MGGYEAFKKSGISEASRLTGISRPTIYTILKKYPKKPSRTVPRYFEDWEKTGKFFLEKHKGRIKSWKKHYKVGLIAWKNVLNRKDPMLWDIEDFRKLWRYEKFIDSMTGKIRFTIAVSLKLWMRTIGRHDLDKLDEFSTRGLKRPKGRRKMWFLEDEDIKKMIQSCDRRDVLVFARLGMESGARASSLLLIKPEHINYERNIILMYEPKVKDYVPRFFNQCTMLFLKQYIQDYSIQPDQLLFPSYDTVNKYLRLFGEAASLPKGVSTHILKHTFVSQASYHGVSLEIVSEQTGTDPATLLQYYAGIKEEKVRHELLGEKMERKKFNEWVNDLDNLWVQRYNQIPYRSRALVKKPERPRKKREINWKAIRQLVENSRTPEPLRKYWLHRLQQRDSGDQ